MEPSAPPFAGLTPDTLLDAVETLGLRPDGSLLALNSYENRVYQIGMDEGPPLVAKFYRPERWTETQILEEHAFVAALAGLEIPVVPALDFAGHTLHRHADYRFALFPRRGGRMPDFDQADTLMWMGRFMGRIHALGASQPYQHRPALNIETFGEEPLAWLMAHDWLPAELREVYQGVARQALDGVRRCFDRAGAVRSIRLHGDCHAGNVLWTDDGPHFVDFDDSRSGPAVQDLWMLLSGERSDQVRQLADLLAGYEDFCEFDTRELYLIEALRTLRLMHYSAWLARRWHDPAFPAAFPWFGSQRYWQDRILELREQIALMDEPPLWPV
ncbi:serine/threonine protein kinase [Paludibacterium sp. B53371]|uniref:serine/threonine protein kinase n=1 Tax=Paludibacterium sp. B53371 TaxID=2806263 RepID=UPI001C05CB76|nr:serine/threonine protein kinase [Paludibacterium sp. B53371]